MTWPVLTATELQNLSAGAFDVRYQYFSGRSALCAAHDLAAFTYNELPTGWTASGDNVTPAGAWEAIPSAILYDGALTQSLDGAQITWEATLRGFGYDDETLSDDYVICCLRRIRRTGYDSGWLLFWLGIVASHDVTNDARQGKAFSLTVRDLSYALRITDAPRIVVAPIDIALGATTIASSTLGTPALEAGNLEFIGTSAVVTSDKVVDGRKATCWIAQDAPTVTAEAAAGATWGPIIDEFFCWPVAGYTDTNAWWAEIYHAGDVDMPANKIFFACQNQAGASVCVMINQPLNHGERGIVCGDIKIFEAMTGGAKNCKWVVCAKDLGVVNYRGRGASDYGVGATPGVMNLSPADGWVGVGGGYGVGFWNMLWWGAPTFPPGTWFVPEVGSPTRNDHELEVNVVAMPVGSSLRRYPSGSKTTTKREAYPRPGALGKWTANVPEYFKIELPAHTTTLAVDSLAGATELIFLDTTGWPESGAGLLGVEEFSYTGRTRTTLTGIPAANLSLTHTAGENAYPLNAVSSEAMTGWPLGQLTIARMPGRTPIKRLTVYLSRYADTDVPDLNDNTKVAWLTDYDPDPLNVENGTLQTNAASTLIFDLSQRPAGNLFVRSILILIHEMWDGGRAKINEVTAHLAASTIEDATVADIGVTKSADLAHYLIDNYALLPEGTQWGALGGGRFIDETPAGYGVLGRLALAVSPLAGVLEDLARVTGCIAEWTLDGHLTWWPDPWWPGGQLTAGPDLDLWPNDWRGEKAQASQARTLTGIALSAQSTAGEPLPRLVVPPGATGSGVQELTGYVVTAANLPAVAKMLYRKNLDTRTVTVTFTGPAEAIRPLLRANIVDIAGDLQNWWLIESVEPPGPARAAPRPMRPRPHYESLRHE